MYLGDYTNSIPVYDVSVPLSPLRIANIPVGGSREAGIHDIHIHTANDQPVAEPGIPDEMVLETLARQMIQAFEGQPDTATRLLDGLCSMEPFNRNPEASARIAERLRQ